MEIGMKKKRFKLEEYGETDKNLPSCSNEKVLLKICFAVQAK